MMSGERGNRISLLQRRVLYAIALALFLSGLLWLLADWFAPVSDIDPLAMAIKLWALRLHGAAAMGILVAFGMLLPTHVLPGWALRRQLATGAGNVVSGAVLGATGWGLYYAGDEGLRSRLSGLHWMLGIAAAAVLVFHVVQGRRARRARGEA